MGRITWVKRQLLRDVVEENVSTMEGRRWDAERDQRPFWYRVGRWTLLVGTPIAMFASSYLLAQATADWRKASLLEKESAEALARAQLFIPAMPTRPVFASLGAAAGRSFTEPTVLDRRVLPLAIRRVVLDPGHGGEHRGTSGSNGLVEKEITLDISRRLKTLLEAAGYEVVLTRGRDATVPLEERGEIANASQGDIFISVHVNWLQAPGLRAVETFYLGPTEDPYVKKLAAQENLDSGFRLAHYREALDRVYAGVRQDESRKLAESIQRQLLLSLRTINPSVESRGVKSAPFAVLIRTEMPAILAEVGCLSNSDEAVLLGNESYRQYLAESLFSGIESYGDSLNQSG